MEKDILNIYCPSCAAPARFDIKQQRYLCGYCGSKVTVQQVREEKESLQEKRVVRVRENLKSFSLMSTSCTGCGATLVFKENEAISNCEFCGRSLVRSKYKYHSNFPTSVIPFGVTREEAVQKLAEWCEANSRKREAKHLRPKLEQLKGYYLPYDMISGPVSCDVRRSDDVETQHAEGYIEKGFVNCSDQLDNLVLDAMEPYDLSELKEFDFAYVAGHSVKLPDVDKKEEQARIDEEIHENYRLEMNRLWDTKALTLSTEFTPAVRLPVLLPVYYLSDGEVRAAVNGQTGKVSVRAEKTSVYITPPWWLKALLIIVTFDLSAGALIWLDYRNLQTSQIVFGILTALHLFLFLFMIKDSFYHLGTFTRYRRIFTSGKNVFRREQGELVARELLNEKIAEPMFVRKLNREKTEMVYCRFCPPRRMVGIFAAGYLITYWPIILALIINGFSMEKLELKYAGIWLLVALPTAPVILIREAVQWLYERPWIYDRTADGRLVRRTLWTRLKRQSKAEKRENVKTLATLLLVPPLCLLSWGVIALLGVMVYYTAFGGVL